MRKVPPTPVYLVQWRDTVLLTNGWQSPEGLAVHADDTIHWATGFKVAEDEHTITLCAARQDARESYANCVVVPRATIITAKAWNGR